MNSQQDPNITFSKAFESILQIIAQRVVTVWMHPDFIYNKLPIYKLFEENRTMLYDFVDKVLNF